MRSKRPGGGPMADLTQIFAQQGPLPLKTSVNIQSNMPAVVTLAGSVWSNAAGAPRAALADMGLVKGDDAEHAAVSDTDRHDVPRFLNRVLALDCDRQNAVFDLFFERFEAAVERAREAGTLDTGVVDVTGLSIT